VFGRKQNRGFRGGCSVCGTKPKIAAASVFPTVLALDEASIQKRLCGEDKIDYQQQINQYLQIPGGDLVLLEGPGTMDEGNLFNLSLLQMAERLMPKCFW
jgi:BioD-like phosphotransacetylase family protein